MGTGPAQPAGLPAGLGFSPSLGISDILSCLGEAGSQGPHGDGPELRPSGEPGRTPEPGTPRAATLGPLSLSSPICHGKPLA